MPHQHGLELQLWTQIRFQIRWLPWSPVILHEVRKTLWSCCWPRSIFQQTLDKQTNKRQTENENKRKVAQSLNLGSQWYASVSLKEKKYEKIDKGEKKKKRVKRKENIPKPKQTKNKQTKRKKERSNEDTDRQIEQERKSGSISVSGHLPTYPSPNPALTLTWLFLG